MNLPDDNETLGWIVVLTLCALMSAFIWAHILDITP